jgi:hypothetical protein
MELFLTGYIRSQLTDAITFAAVGNREPSFDGTNPTVIPLVKPIVVVRDDSGAAGELRATFDRSIGVSVLAGTKSDMKPANDLARLVYAILTDPDIIEADGSPIATIDYDGCNGPYAVTEEIDVARRYMTVEYTVVGSLS